MHWYTLNNLSSSSAAKTRAFVGKRAARTIRVNYMTTLIGVGKHEAGWLEQCSKDYNFFYLTADPPGETHKTLCGVEMLSPRAVPQHSSRCNACQRLKSNGTQAPQAPQAPPRITMPSAQAQVTAEARGGNQANAGAPVTSFSFPPKTTKETTLKYLLHDMETRERHAFQIAEEYGNALKAWKAVETSDAALKELQAQLDADRKRLLAFISAEGPA